jgi:hypothetical protein
MTNTTLPTVAEFQRGKLNLAVVEAIASGSETVTTPAGTVHHSIAQYQNTLAGVVSGSSNVTTPEGIVHKSLTQHLNEIELRADASIASMGFNTVGSYADNPRIENINDTVYYAATATDWRLKDGKSRPYDIDSTTYETPNDDPNLQLVSRRDQVTSIEELRSRGLETGYRVYLSCGHRSGWFEWDSSDLSYYVTSDTESAIYISRNSDLSGVSGAWVREYSRLNFRHFGLAMDGSDETVKAQAMLNTAIALELSQIDYPSGNLGVTNLRWQSSHTIEILGLGKNSILTILGDDTDAETYTLSGESGSTTVTANIMFIFGGTSKSKICNFRVIGNENVSYGVLFTRMFKGSETPRIIFESFSKPGAVPVTYYNNVSLEAPNLLSDSPSRFIRLLGMNDACHFKAPTCYNWDESYVPIFSEAAYLDAGDVADRSAVGLLIEAPYSFRYGDVAGTFIELNDISKARITDVWPEGAEVSVHLNNCEKAYVHALGAVSTGSGTSRVKLTSTITSTIDCETAIEADSNSLLNTLKTKTSYDNLLIANEGGQVSIEAKDKILLSRLFIGTTSPEREITQFKNNVEFTPLYSSTGGGTSATYDNRSGVFTRIGNVVHFSINLGTDSVTVGDGSLTIAGLPFVAAYSAGGSCGPAYNFATSLGEARWRISAGDDYIVLFNGENSAIPSDALSFGTGENANRIWITGSYFA